MNSILSAIHWNIVYSTILITIKIISLKFFSRLNGTKLVSI